MRQVIDGVMASAPPYEVECRQNVCRIRPAGMDIEAFRGLITSINSQAFSLFSAVEIGRDPDAVYYQFQTPEETQENADRARVLNELGARFRASEPREDCRKRYPAAGQLLLHLRLDDSRRVVVTSSGELASDPVGECLRAAFEHMASTVSFPASVKTIPHAEFLVKL